MKYYTIFSLLAFVFLLAGCNAQNPNKSYYVGKNPEKGIKRT